MLTPIDIDNKVFKKAKIGGYDIKDVEDFLVLVMGDYEKLYKENSEMRGQVEALQQAVDNYSQLEAGIDRTVENAQTEADSIKLEAQKEAETIKSSAEEEASKKLEDLQRQIIKAEVDIETKKNQMRIYKIKVQSMLEAQLKILNDGEEEQ
jgi:cell division initiation protein